MCALNTLRSQLYLRKFPQFWVARHSILNLVHDNAEVGTGVLVLDGGHSPQLAYMSTHTQGEYKGISFALTRKVHCSFEHWRFLLPEL